MNYYYYSFVFLVTFITKHCFNASWIVAANVYSKKIRVVDVNELSLRIITTVEYIFSIAITDSNHIVASCDSEILVFDAKTLTKIRTINLPMPGNVMMSVKPHGAGFFAFNSRTFSLFQVKI